MFGTDKAPYLLAISTACTFFLAGCQPTDTGHQGIVNPGFEDGLKGWQVTTPDENQAYALVREESAHSGNSGLHVVDTSEELDVLIAHERRVPVTPGRTHGVAFMGRAPVNNNGICVFIRFFDGQGSLIPKEDGHRYLAELEPDQPEWKSYSVTAVAPPGAAEMDVYIRTNKRGVLEADLDDFRLIEE